MEPSSATEARVRRVSVLISAIGIAAAVLIYCLNGPQSRDSADPAPDDSKIYVRDVEKYGGQGELLLRDFNDEFAGLWHGRRLALTVLVLTGAALWIYRFVALSVSSIGGRS